MLLNDWMGMRDSAWSCAPGWACGGAIRSSTTARYPAPLTAERTSTARIRIRTFLSRMEAIASTIAPTSMLSHGCRSSHWLTSSPTNDPTTAPSRPMIAVL